jgi:hypothetical protein
MKKRALGIVAASAFAIAAIGAPAAAFTNGGGNSADAPGQANAFENCLAVLAKQYEKGVIPGNGAHAGDAATNCDHYWNP